MENRARKKIVIDPGHGGSDPGTSGNGIIEKDYTLKISNYMKKRFDDLGIEASLTRDSDISLSPNERPKKAQSLYGNSDDVILISNHINAGGGDGAEIIYALRNNDTLSKTISKEIENAGQNVRKYYQRRLPSNPAKDYYFILRDTPNNEAIIVEYGFVDSTKDDVNQLKNNWQALAEAVVKGVANYIGVPYKENEFSTNTNYYIVKSGDTLWNIAKNYNITVDELKKANDLINNTLNIGQQLFIPSKTISPTPSTDFIYTVKYGDTLYAIANKYNTTVDELKKLNNLNTNNLSINQKLKIKDNSNELIEENFTTYIVSKGDTLYNIANQYNISVDELKKINNLNTNNLSINQILKIPVMNNNNTFNYTTYTVKKGDTLYAIANKFNTTVDELKKLNNLYTNNLSINQSLKIPN